MSEVPLYSGRLGPRQACPSPRRFRWGWIPECFVTKSAPHKALKVSARGKLIFDEKVAQGYRKGRTGEPHS